MKYRATETTYIFTEDDSLTQEQIMSHFTPIDEPKVWHPKEGEYYFFPDFQFIECVGYRKFEGGMDACKRHFEFGLGTHTYEEAHTLAKKMLDRRDKNTQQENNIEELCRYSGSSLTPDYLFTEKMNELICAVNALRGK